MKYEETYVRLNWSALNREGISRPNNSEVVINSSGCLFFKGVSCPYSLSMLVYMACHVENNIFGAQELYDYFFDDSRASQFFFETIFERLLEAKFLIEIE